MRAALECTIHGPRGDEWEQVCGRRTFPVTSFDPLPVELPGIGETTAWIMNVRLLDSSTQQRIFAHLASKFGASIGEVREDCLKRGIPILSRDATVVLNDPQRWVG